MEWGLGEVVQVDGTLDAGRPDDRAARAVRTSAVDEVMASASSAAAVGVSSDVLRLRRARRSWSTNRILKHASSGGHSGKGNRGWFSCECCLDAVVNFDPSCSLRSGQILYRGRVEIR